MVQNGEGIIVNYEMPSEDAVAFLFSEIEEMKNSQRITALPT